MHFEEEIVEVGQLQHIDGLLLHSQLPCLLGDVLFQAIQEALEGPDGRECFNFEVDGRQERHLMLRVPVFAVMACSWFKIFLEKSLCVVLEPPIVDLLNFEAQIDGAEDGLKRISVDEALHQVIALKQIDCRFDDLLPQHGMIRTVPVPNNLDHVAEIALLKYPIVEVWALHQYLIVGLVSLRMESGELLL